MGGEIDWNALPVLMTMYGLDDVETLVAELIAIRDHQIRQAQG